MINRVNVFQEALRLSENSDLAAKNCIEQAMFNLNVSETVRHLCWEVFSDSILEVKIGHGSNFDKECLKIALKHVGGIPNKVSAGSIQNITKIQDNIEVRNLEKKLSIVNNKDNEKYKTKKYQIGDILETVASFGLQPIEAKDGNNPLIKFQFSRKIKREGIKDIPSNTKVTFLGLKQVFEHQSSKKMIFKIDIGTSLLDGTNLLEELEVAGVSNHIDPDDPYNRK